MLQGRRAVVAVCTVFLTLCACGPEKRAKAPEETVTLSGRIVDAGRLPVSGARVQVYVHREVTYVRHPEYHPSTLDLVGETTTDADGRFKMERVPRLPVKIKASKPLHREFSGMFEPEQLGNVEILLDSSSSE